jgi:hypothetical protein
VVILVLTLKVKYESINIHIRTYKVHSNINTVSIISICNINNN